MKLMDLWRAKLKSAKIQRQIAQRQLNAAQRAVDRLNLTIFDLENKLERHMAQPKPKTQKHD
jgi:hypothetical protein